MPELPWEKWYPTNWASEPGLRLCEAATRGIWFEAINTMMLQQSHSISGNSEQLASLLACRVSQLDLAISQLKQFGVAEIIEQNGNIIISCRKRQRLLHIKHLRATAGMASGNKRRTNGQQPVRTKLEQNSASASVYASDGGYGGKVYSPESRALVHFLKEQSGRKFRETESSLEPISARLSEPDVNFEGCKKMIVRQCLMWKDDPKMAEYLRPETLFNKTKFNSYYAAKDLPVSKNSQNNHPQHIDRSIGTANEGTADRYEGLGRVVSHPDCQ